MSIKIVLLVVISILYCYTIIVPVVSIYEIIKIIKNNKE